MHAGDSEEILSAAQHLAARLRASTGYAIETTGSAGARAGAGGRARRLPHGTRPVSSQILLTSTGAKTSARKATSSMSDEEPDIWATLLERDSVIYHDNDFEVFIDPDRVYLTGHSMGGHGTWHLGETFPDRFAAIGPSAGWLSFWSYRAKKLPDDDGRAVRKILLRATSPSDTLGLATNLRHLGIYIIHGREDDNVSVEESRAMVARLSAFHKDLVYHEQPGAGHWWDLSDDPGADCVDWPPLFDFFARHARPATTRNDSGIKGTPPWTWSPTSSSIPRQSPIAMSSSTATRGRTEPGEPAPRKSGAGRWNGRPDRRSQDPGARSCMSLHPAPARQRGGQRRSDLGNRHRRHETGVREALSRPGNPLSGLRRLQRERIGTGA